MLTQLTNNFRRILKHNILRFDNDASACYDCIIVALGMLAVHRSGMPSNAIQLHAEALQSMYYTVKSAFGVSTGGYTGTNLEPLFGTGQGSGVSPSIWLSLKIVMLCTLGKLVKERMQFDSFIGDSSHKRLVDAFVDNISSLGFTCSPGQSTPNELISCLQSIAQTWEHTLFLSGGKLNLSKCSLSVSVTLDKLSRYADNSQARLDNHHHKYMAHTT
jgi:hypothetical protein